MEDRTDEAAQRLKAYASRAGVPAHQVVLRAGGAYVTLDDLHALLAEIDRLRSLPTWEQAREQAAALCDARMKREGKLHDVHPDSRGFDQHRMAASARMRTADDLARTVRTMTPGDGEEPG